MSYPSERQLSTNQSCYPGSIGFSRYGIHHFQISGLYGRDFELQLTRSILPKFVPKQSVRLKNFEKTHLNV